MNITKRVIQAFLVFSVVTTAWAVPPGVTLKYSANPQGPVLFSGETHAKKQLTCADCHTRIFQQKKGAAKIKLADHMQGKAYCFSCHNGERAFEPTGNCARCHN